MLAGCFFSSLITDPLWLCSARLHLPLKRHALDCISSLLISLSFSCSFGAVTRQNSSSKCVSHVIACALIFTPYATGLFVGYIAGIKQQEINKKNFFQFPFDCNVLNQKQFLNILRTCLKLRSLHLSQ